MDNIRAKLILGNRFPRQVMYVMATINNTRNTDSRGTIQLPRSVQPSTLFVNNNNGDNPLEGLLIFFHNGKQTQLSITLQYDYHGSTQNVEERTIAFHSTTPNTHRVNTHKANTHRANTHGVNTTHICNHTHKIFYKPISVAVATHEDNNDGGRGLIVAHVHEFNQHALQQARSSYTPPLSMADAPAYVNILLQAIQSINTRLEAIEDALLANQHNRNSNQDNLPHARGLTLSLQHISMSVAAVAPPDAHPDTHPDTHPDAHPDAHPDGNPDAHLAQGRSLLLTLPIKSGNISMTFQLPCDIVGATTSTDGTTWLQCSFWEMDAEVREEVAKYIFYHDRAAMKLLTEQQTITPTD